jgi:MFS family permease
LLANSRSHIQARESVNQFQRRPGEEMKRPALVLASAAALILLSLTQILMALVMGLAATLEHTHEIPGAPQASPGLLYCLCAFFLGLSVWGIVTAVALSKLRRWARHSILIIGGCMAFFGFVGMAGMLVAMLLAPFLLATTGDIQHGSLTTVRVLFGSFTFIYAAVTAIGIFWLAYFNRKTVRTVFPGGENAAAESRPPVLISVFAVYSFLKLPILLLLAFLPVPAIFFGIALIGWKKVVLYLICAAVSAAVGIGMLKMAEWARRLALAYVGVLVAMTVIGLARPSVLIHASEAGRAALGESPSPLPVHVQSILFSGLYGFALLLALAIAWMLHYYRGRFVPPAPATSVAEV